MDNSLMTAVQQPAPLFLFPYSHTMKAFLFGNFEEQLCFDCLSDDEVIEVLTEINASTNTKASLRHFDLKDETRLIERPPPLVQDKSKVTNASVVASPEGLTFKGSFG